MLFHYDDIKALTDILFVRKISGTFISGAAFFQYSKTGLLGTLIPLIPGGDFQ